MLPDVDSLLRASGIDAPETTLVHNGFSGARISTIVQADERYVLKRMRYADDWIMRVTNDVSCREAQFAASPLPERLPHGVSVPTLGAARDGDGHALLMSDVSSALLPDDGIVPDATMGVVLQRLAEMHVAFWEMTRADVAVDWLVPELRSLILSPSTGALLVDEDHDFGMARGWELFEQLAPPDASRLARALFDDPAPLNALLASLPRTLIHGDAKIANMALDAKGTLWLLDWALVTRAPVALEVAWFLAVNSSRLPWPLDDTIARYAGHLERALGRERFERAHWPRQRAAIALTGLLLGGWMKSLDHEAGHPDELAWWCERATTTARRLGW